MTLAGYMFGQFSWLQYLEFLIRLLVSCLCGACIGFERTKRLKEAGVRTHIIVCCAAALTMIVSKYGFADMSSNGVTLYGTHGADPARLAAQIISGVSFLGAGIIFRNGNSVRGLTTAAGIWATAGIGLAIGSGLYVIGIVGTVIVALIQVLMHKFTIGVDSMNIGKLSCTVVNREAFRAALDAYVALKKMQVIANKVTYHDDGSVTFEYTLHMNADITINDLTDFLGSVDGVRAISCELSR